ncbi:hypothetical protein N008_18805 [Hymenobacter sp. APR13]|nr:hypothetical protein N008_18805 [Hymenobacter sp. APR13]
MVKSEKLGYGWEKIGENSYIAASSRRENAGLVNGKFEARLLIDWLRKRKPLIIRVMAPKP